jgi:hypothetical protein
MASVNAGHHEQGQRDQDERRRSSPRSARRIPLARRTRVHRIELVPVSRDILQRQLHELVFRNAAAVCGLRRPRRIRHLVAAPHRRPTKGQKSACPFRSPFHGSAAPPTSLRFWIANVLSCAFGFSVDDRRCPAPPAPASARRPYPLLACVHHHSSCRIRFPASHVVGESFH